MFDFLYLYVRFCLSYKMILIILGYVYDKQK